MIKIAHLYYDLLNLYGENGNVLALKDYLEGNNIEYQIDFITVDDKINFNQYDLIYVGSGTENNILIALEDIKKYQKDLKDYINNNKYLIATGNSNILFGKNYLTLDKKEHDCLNIFDYTSKETPFRTVGEQFYKDQNNEEIIGFLNHQVLFKNYDSNLFKVMHGNGYAPHKNKEGLKINNFYGTLLIGPLLIRNPLFTKRIINNLLDDHKLIKKDYLNIDSLKAYDTYIRLFK